ncbi:MAG TPA: efflux RND transporter permease subunit [Xanthobacteraceae bacterium]|jgi:HAE1 family hydrophobic/amphiphilic exporter-1/multidrug efflux pump|nr:efflux RND transporter permease subunit [Xanthobacteraceae bacterium]
MNISERFIRRPVATYLLMAGIVILGVIAYPLLPVGALPEVEFPTIQVTASFSGASPETMASAVATPLERQFAQIPGITQMTSSSGLGTTSIVLQFDLNRSIDGAAQDVQTAIDASSGVLPKNLPTPPTFRKVNPADSPIMNLFVQSNDYPLTVVDDYTDTILAQQISQIPGIALVNIDGEQKPSVRVQVDPAKIASLGLSLEDIRAMLSTATNDAPKGYFDGPAQSFTIYDNDQLLHAAPYNDLILAYRNGSPIKVRDIGRAVDAAENTKISAWHYGKQGVLLVVFKQPNANIIETVDGVRKALPGLQAALPPGIDVSVLIDRTGPIRASIADVKFTMLLTIVLVVGVIFLFLRDLWATVIPGVTVPLSIVGTLALMYALGYSIDNLSLMGLTIAVGFVVDDAIVMLENIYRHMEAGMDRFQAALKGAGEIGFTIVSISVSLIAVFIPVLFMSGIVGRLLREFAVVVTITIAMSAFVSLTLTPMMCARYLSDHKHAAHGWWYLKSEAFFDWLLRAYDRGLKWSLAHRRVMMGVLFFTMAATVYLYVVMPKGFFPQEDTGYVQGISEARQDISFDAMTQHQFALADIIGRDPGVADVAFVVGVTGGSQSNNNGRFWINLKPRNERTASADQIISRLRPQLAKVPGISAYLQAQQDVTMGGRPARSQFQYTLQDANLDELGAWSPVMLDKLRSLPELRDVATDQQSNATAATLTIDRDTAGRFGIQPQVIDDTLYDAFGQRWVTQYFTQLNEYHVVMEVDPMLQSDPAALDHIYINSPTTGQPIPLSLLVKVDTSKSTYLTISHQGQFPAVTISFNLASGVALSDALTAIQTAERELHKPAALQATFQGTAQAFQASLSTQPLLILATIVAVYIILGMLYESYIHPITILSTLPSAGLGALIVLRAGGYELSIIAIIGIILLIGIVKKNAIMMIDFALAAEREEGMSPAEAIYQACLLRFRPIMMTTMAALLGGLPLMLGGGTGAEIRRPLGFAIVGGLVVSQYLTLYTTPVVYLYLDRLNKWLSGERAKAPSRVQALLVTKAI